MADRELAPSRFPRNLQGLLKLCLEQTAQEDSTNNVSSHQEMSEERRRWLSQTIDSMTCDRTKIIKDHLLHLVQFVAILEPSEEQCDAACDVIDNASDWCEDLDVANDFVKIGGMSVMERILSHSDARVRCLAFSLVVSLVQNNPTCQSAALDNGLMTYMVNLLAVERNSDVQVQAVQAISCLLRGCESEAAYTQFLSCNGFQVLKLVLEVSSNFKCTVKVAFLLTALNNSCPAAHRDAICSSGLLHCLVSGLKGEHNQYHEVITEALLAISKDHSVAQQVLISKELGMIEFLRQRIQILQGEAAYQEERQYAAELLRMLETVVA